ncbi:MAG: type II secretion system protein GspL [Gammaproteobacteria bacterium]|nr:type II secretion system protein GspL [Gammaproteobacteria bacterium]
MLWRAGAAACEPVSEDTVFPEGVVVGLPSDDVRSTLLKVSPVELKHLSKSLPYMMEEQVAEDVEELHFVASALGDEQFLVAFTRQDKMADWVEQLSFNDSLKVFGPEALCLPLEGDECCAVVDGDEVVLRWSDAHGARIDLSLLSTVLDSLAQIPSSLVIYGTDREQVVSQLTDDQAALVDWRQGGWGALLLLTKSAPQVNLRQGSFAPPLPLVKWWGVWKAVAIAASVALSLQFVSDVSQFQTLKQQNLELRSAIQDSYRKANPRGAVVDAEKQLDRQIAEFAGEESVTAFTPKLVDVVTATMAQSGRVTSINYTSGQLRLNLTAQDFASVEQIRQALERAGLKATLETSSARGDEVRARLRIEVS